MKEDLQMRKLLSMLKQKGSMIHVLNAVAMAMIVYTANATCLWTEHQPEAPEDLRRFRRF